MKISSQKDEAKHQQTSPSYCSGADPMNRILGLGREAITMPIKHQYKPRPFRDTGFSQASPLTGGRSTRIGAPGKARPDGEGAATTGVVSLCQIV
jgi:hypothetical protein